MPRIGRGAGAPPYWRDEAWQDGVLTRGQVLASGLTDSWIRARLDAGLWQRLLPGVFLTHNGVPEAAARIWAAVLYAGAGAGASHRTAGFLDGLIDTAPPDVDVVVPGRRRVRPQPGLIVHRVARPAINLARRPPRTDAPTTILDLAATYDSAEAVVGLVTRAYALKVARPDTIAAALRQRGRQRWRDLFDELVGDADGLESALEWRYRRDVERPHGLPTPQRQVVVRAGSASFRRDIDYEEYGVVIELDGRRGHEGVGAFRDAARDNAALLAGRVTLRYGWWDVRCNACGSASQVATVLRDRGWSGVPTPCGPACAISTETLRH
jgi:hypothetical protein